MIRSGVSTARPETSPQTQHSLGAACAPPRPPPPPPAARPAPPAAARPPPPPPAPPPPPPPPARPPPPPQLAVWSGAGFHQFATATYSPVSSDPPLTTEPPEF